MKLCEGHSMERRNTAIIKSKSSSMKTQKPQTDKFWSNANIQNTTDLKKRGLYVEKKPARYSISGFPITFANDYHEESDELQPPHISLQNNWAVIDKKCEVHTKKTPSYDSATLTVANPISNKAGQDEREIQQTPRQRRRRSPKPTRTEQLNLNRQFYNATTGTQFSYQNIEVDESPKPKKKVKKLLNRMFNPDEGVPETAMEKLKKHDKKKNKYVSKYLNRKEQREKNSIVILQPRKNMIRAQSSHSNWSSDEARQRSNSSMNHQQYDLDNNHNKYNYAPSTVDDDSRKPEEKELYNFFVDLLQTSYSDYKLKEAIAPSNDEDSVKLEIDEHVVEKLKIKPNNYSVELNRNKETNRINQSASYSTEDYKRKLNTTVYTRTPVKKRKPVNNPNKQPKKRRETKKDRIINKIKRELETDDGRVYEVPQTMFEALKAISLRKKKVLRFDDTPAVINKSKKRYNKECFRGSFDDDEYLSSPYFGRKGVKEVVKQSSSTLSNWLGDAEFKRFDDNFDGKLSEDFDDDNIRYDGIDMRFKESYDAVPKLNKSMEHVHRNSVVSFKSYKDPLNQGVDANGVQNIFTNINSLEDDFFMPVNDEFF